MEKSLILVKFEILKMIITDSTINCCTTKAKYWLIPFLYFFLKRSIKIKNALDFSEALS